MPYRSKAQLRKFFAMERRGEISKGTAKKWAKETPSIKSLPEKKKKKNDHLTKKGFMEGLLNFFSGDLPSGEPKFTYSNYEKVKNAYNKVVTTDKILDEIEHDHALTTKEKQKLKKEIIEWKRGQAYVVSKGSADIIPLAGKGVGIAGTTLLSYLLLKDVKMSLPIKMLIGSSIVFMGSSIISGMINLFTGSDRK